MTTTLIVPGLHSSGPSHWQTWLEEQIPDSIRVIQRDWRDANLADWASRVRRDISRNPGRIVIAAHSFGALAAVQAASDHSERIAGLMLVAPADPEKFGITDNLPASPLSFPTVVVASTNDPWISFARAAHWAGVWGAELINLGPAGHINAETGFGPWPAGLAILERLSKAGSSSSDGDSSGVSHRAPLADHTETVALSRHSARRIRVVRTLPGRALARGVG